ncbi:hypothetical protein [Mucilaginibacter rubeus]|nr:hypothetical protein [Mucilaginibacter rubeus]
MPAQGRIASLPKLPGYMVLTTGIDIRYETMTNNLTSAILF